MPRKISAKTADQLADDLVSYADGEMRVRRALKMTSDQLREWALDRNIEKCQGCGWWAASHEMLPDDSDTPDGHCDNCRDGA